MQKWQLQQRQGLPLDAKIVKTQQRISEWYEYFNGEVYVSFSGGKDSTALLHLVREIYPDVEAVFCDTGLEYPEIREFVKSVSNVTWIKPQKSFKEVIKKVGYPVISKDVSKVIYYARQGSLWALNRLKGMNVDNTSDKFKQMYIKYAYLMNSPFGISNKCCDILKKQPFEKIGKKPFIGTMASESHDRKMGYLKTGCNSFDIKKPISKPLGFWTDIDIWEFLHKYDIPYSPIYDMGYDRTGCMFCMFGCHLEKEPNRFQRMQFTHPKQWGYCMKPIAEGGLGLSEVMDYIGVPWKSEYCQLEIIIREVMGCNL